MRKLWEQSPDNIFSYVHWEIAGRYWLFTCCRNKVGWNRWIAWEVRDWDWPTYGDLHDAANGPPEEIPVASDTRGHTNFFEHPAMGGPDYAALDALWEELRTDPSAFVLEILL